MFSAELILDNVIRTLDDIAADDTTTWTDAELHEAVGHWCHANSRLHAAGARLLAVWDARQLWALDGALNGPHWLRTHGELDRATRELRIARRLRDWCPRTAAALASGELSATRAAVLALAPVVETAQDFADCEQVLVETAKQLTVAQTVTLVNQWKLIAESELGGDAGDPEQVRRNRRYLRIWETFDGLIAIEGILDQETGAIIRAVLAERERQLLRDDIRDARTREHAGSATNDAGPDPDTDAALDPDDLDIDPASKDPVDDHGIDPDLDPDLDPGGLRLPRTAGQRKADALAELLRLGSDAASSHHDDRLGGPDTQLVINVGAETLTEAAIRRAERTLRLPGLGPHEQPAAAIDCDLPTPVARLLTRSHRERTARAARHRHHLDHVVDQALSGRVDRYGAHLDDHDHPVDPTTLGLLACDCTIQRMVLDAQGVPLDLGRTQRLVSRAQRRALRARDGGCAFPDCDRPPSWCDAHHIIPWEIGGPTDLDNLVLLCRKHHTLQHTRNPWTCRIDPTTRRPEFYDPDGQPLVVGPKRARTRSRPPDLLRSVASVA